MESKLIVDVCLSPQLYPAYERENNIVVVIDVLRATSAMCTAFEYGVEKMIPVATLEEAAAYKQKGYLVGAERNGIPVDGFDFGNSPFSYMTEIIKGKTVVISTTNGTQAIEAARNASKVVIGAFTNITSLCNWLIEQNKHILLLCSGWKNRLNLEDSVFAGAVADRLLKTDKFQTGDAALASLFLYQQTQQSQIKFFHNSSHSKRLAAMGLKKDIKYCFSLDKTSIIPVLKDGALVPM